MFYEFGLIEHILIILSIIVFSTRKNLFYFIIIAISLFIQLFITWQLSVLAFKIKDTFKCVSNSLKCM
jgi:hypothetical protein